MTEDLRARLALPQGVHAPGAYDALSALLIEEAGFDAVYLSGASIAYSQLGRPDIGLVSFSEVADVLARVRDRIELPIIIDADTGFGNALNVQRTVRLFERFGANAIQLEDQTMPKRCGHLAGKQLISLGEMVGKIAAATDARASASTLIIARTDAIAVEGLDRALERAEHYLQAGADILFIEALRTREDLTHAADLFAARVPLLANMVEGGKTPLIPVPELVAMGFPLVISPGALLRNVVPVAETFLSALRRDGSSSAALENMLDLSGINQRVGLNAMLDHGARYAPDKQDGHDR
ncbi:MAG: 2-methylisocitrate lyase-like PEP mutase family enzyme [Halieaceae bacterium]|jgi:2-methylisocitrate lyase-like PEP mutase family enzyme